MKDAVFVDSNILLRLLLDDHPTHSPAARRLMRRVEDGTETVWTSHLVIAEVVWTLAGPLYLTSRGEIAGWLLRLIDLAGFKISRKQVFRRVFALYTTHSIDYVDAYHAAVLESYGQQELYSFDRDFDKVEGLTRLEPAGGGSS